MITIKFNKSVIKVVDKIQKKVDDQTQEALNRMVDYATASAQRTFDNFTIEVPSDDPYVWVISSPLEKKSKRVWGRSIRCIGNQVLFIEFGAGVYFYTEVEARIYQRYLGGLDHKGNVPPYVPKWGRSRGLDDLWFYKSQTGRESETAHLVKYNRAGEPIMITHGNRPARALYRAVGMAVMRLARGKLK